MFYLFVNIKYLFIYLLIFIYLSWDYYFIKNIFKSGIFVYSVMVDPYLYVLFILIDFILVKPSIKWNGYMVILITQMGKYWVQTTLSVQS
jgi:hypothetical protein